jgi:hypothetical protein
MKPHSLAMMVGRYRLAADEVARAHLVLERVIESAVKAGYSVEQLRLASEILPDPAAHECVPRAVLLVAGSN